MEEEFADIYRLQDVQKTDILPRVHQKIYESTFPSSSFGHHATVWRDFFLVSSAASLASRSCCAKRSLSGQYWYGTRIWNVWPHVPLHAHVPVVILSVIPFLACLLSWFQLNGNRPWDSSKGTHVKVTLRTLSDSHPTVSSLVEIGPTLEEEFLTDGHTL